LIGKEDGKEAGRSGDKKMMKAMGEDDLGGSEVAMMYY